MKPTTVNSIFKISMSIAVVLVSLSLFMFSINHATASPPTPDKFFQNGSNTIGKYAISTTTKSDVLCATIMNTETGISQTYYASNNASSWSQYTNQTPTPNF